MTQVSRKGFRDKNGRKVVIIPPKEEYTGEAIFSDSDAIDTILSEGVHHISYKRDGKRHPTQHILVVTRDYGKTGPIAPTREIVFQLLIDDLGGMMKRYRKFTDTELLEPDGDWTEWVSMIPTVDSTITEDGDNPVTGAAIYAALDGKAASTHSHAISDVTNLSTSLDSKIGYAGNSYGINIIKDTNAYPISDERLQADISLFVSHVSVGKVVVCRIGYGASIGSLTTVYGLAWWEDDTSDRTLSVKMILGSSLFETGDLQYSGNHVIDFTNAAWSKEDLGAF